MKIFDNIKHNSYTAKEFVEFLMLKKYDVKSILLNDNHFETICYYIEFLENNNMFIITDHNGYIVYKQFNDKQIIIDGNMIDRNIIPKFIAAIINAFDYIENPF